MKAPAMKEIPMRELWVVGRLKTGEVLTVRKLLAPKQGHPQFKNQLASRKSFEANEQQRAANGAWFTHTIFKNADDVAALGVDISKFDPAPLTGTQELFSQIGYVHRQKRYDAACLATSMENPVQRSLLLPETSEKS